nr:PASTA domain-containing protein [Acidimicrobiia bacterium]
VPDVVGRTVDEASAALRELRLEVDLEPAVFDNEVPDGVVISATPAAGEVLERGATVVLAPSKGPDLVAVPDLSGLTLPQAREALAAAGLQVGAVVGNSLGTFELATVDGDEVGAGEEILRNSAVDVVFF